MPTSNFALSALLSLSLFPALILHAQQRPDPASDSSIQLLADSIPKLMQKAGVPGMAVALIRHRRLVWTRTFGWMNQSTRTPASDRSVFEANSLSKPVFSYAVLSLADKGKIDLDKPVTDYLDKTDTVSDDPRIHTVTARMILSHTSGLSERHRRLIFLFEPGEKFMYSPDGTNLLGFVVEKITGMPLEQFMRVTILQPLGMTASDYVWRSEYDSLRAYRHDWSGQTRPDRFHWQHGAPCCSLQTTLVDYSKFIIAAMNGSLLTPKSREAISTPVVQLSPNYAGVFWSLCWGLERGSDGSTIAWQWGDGGDSKGYVLANLQSGDGLLVFANSANGLSFMRELASIALPGSHESISYLAYPHYDDPSEVLARVSLHQGAAAALLAWKDSTLSESDVNTAGYELLDIHRTADAIVLFEYNTTQHPDSYNAWDSQAEATKAAGDKPKAIACYRRSLQLNPANQNAKDMIDQLSGSN
jgi:CubicO group peptidase (beta-lactamase class C family)